MKQKRLNKQSGLTIPKDIRAQAGFFPGMAVDVSVDEQQQVIVRQHIPTCQLCGSITEVRSVAGITICKSCAQTIIAKFK